MAMTEEQKVAWAEKMRKAKEAKKLEKVENKDEFITKDEFNGKIGRLENSINSLVDIIKNNVSDKTEIKKPEFSNKEVDEAKASSNPVSPIWEAKALEIIGEALDHCEVYYPKEGGTLFTVVIKNEFSNATKDYLERMKVDRRTREVSKTGFEGVIEWCKLIKQNLNKNK